MDRVNFDALRARYDIVDYAMKHFVVHQDGTSRYRLVCSFHGDTDPSLVLYPDTQSWHCFGCGRSGDVFDLIAHIEGKTLSEIFSRDNYTEADYIHWKNTLAKKKRVMSLDQWFVVGSIALRSLHDDPEYDSLVRELEDSTLDGVDKTEEVASRLVSKSS